MAYFDWDSSLDIGVDLIDSQHRRIMDYVNDLHEAIQNNDQELVFDVMERLKDYTFDHFAFEEQLMEKAGYPLLEPHIQVHHRFCSRVDELNELLRTGSDPFGVARKTRNDLTRWLIEHIKQEDHNYAALVRKALRQESSWVSGALRKIFGTDQKAS
ncbi:bacteriohemerythrin [Parathalassolituus penaei]|uniref:Bacteriohemerythrin n=1 Tax=Parathalassolituus penaei TaxID=2997323 RepID=A0A9X3IU56_9GAMM|nr:bacteriohemerythrin [Parathalassolituus penaei]MCY0966609.1 bacteriohemerythrin [Parathalassolituus penaei]